MKNLGLTSLAATAASVLVSPLALAGPPPLGMITFGPLAGASQIPVFNGPMLAALLLVMLFLAYKYMAPKGAGRMFFIGAGILASGFALQDSSIIEEAEASGAPVISFSGGDLNTPISLNINTAFYKNNSGITVEVKSITDGACDPTSYGEDVGTDTPVGEVSVGQCMASPTRTVIPAGQGCELTCRALRP